MNRHYKGFTIVELLVVIVVISILSAVTVTAFRGVQAKADTAARLTEMKAWKKHYDLYIAMFEKFPPYPGAPDADGANNIGYCLGTGFPNRDGTGRGNCRDLNGGVSEFAVNSTLNTELAKVGPLPSGPRSAATSGAGSGTLGPFARYYLGNQVQITNSFKGSTCPTGTTNSYTYPNGNGVLCDIWVDGP